MAGEAAHAADEVWPEAPVNISLHNFYFEEISLAPGIRILTENGIMTNAEMAAYVEKLELAKFWTQSL